MTFNNKGLEYFFNSDWYLKQYPDIKKLIDQGKFKSALEHYLQTGTGEQRSPHSGFDESYYLEANADIRDAIAKNEFKCGYHHYLKYGQEEGRPPRQESREEIDAKKVLIEIFDETRDLNFLK